MALQAIETKSQPSVTRGPTSGQGQRRAPVPSSWHRFSWAQRVVCVLATLAPVVIGVVALANAVGFISRETMLGVALGAGEDPGMVVFGAMFLASPIQWFTGRSQVAVRKYLGIVFYLLAVSNLVMFLLEPGRGGVLSEPFLIAGTIAIAAATPLFMTSSRWSQRVMGMRRWRLLHKATYLVAVALLAHVVLMQEIALGAVLIVAGFAARLPAVRLRLSERGHNARTKPTRTSQQLSTVGCH